MNAGFSGFDPAVCLPSLAAGEIALFCLQLSSFVRSPALEVWLDDEERLRLSRFKVAADATAFLAGRVVLRSCLETILKETTVDLALSPQGKPFCTHAEAPAFNLSHGGGWLAVAFCLDTPIGVDLENLQRELPYETLARRYFSDREIQEVTEKGKEAFMHFWTRKEARLKASGEGLRVRLAELDPEADGWQFVHLYPRETVLVSLAYAGPPREVQMWTLPH
jgi:4'-phosphopantetheinyl transferase